MLLCMKLCEPPFPLFMNSEVVKDSLAAIHVQLQNIMSLCTKLSFSFTVSETKNVRHIIW